MSVNPWKSIPLIRFQNTSYNSKSWGCPGMLQSKSDMDVVSNMRIYHFFVKGLHPIGPETFKFRNFETWLPGTYNNGRAVKY